MTTDTPPVLFGYLGRRLTHIRFGGALCGYGDGDRRQFGCGVRGHSGIETLDKAAIIIIIPSNEFTLRSIALDQPIRLIGSAETDPDIFSETSALTRPAG